jgi:uncharacterized protein YyaL (SSP411 family)
MRFLIPFALVPLFWQASCDEGQHSGKMNSHPYTNALINETSPYLLQHAHNPVNWYPWKAEALEKARAEDKLLIVSIGYAACHWCHVMEHESFEDTTVANYMNAHFVSIKVDREERPDVDDIYMNASFLLTGGGGWPLNAIALPDGRPVYAGTYFPKEDWMQVLDYYQRAFTDNREALERQATQLTEGIRSVDVIPLRDSRPEFSGDSLTAFTTQLLSRVDWKFGGQLGSPKFPMPNIYQFLLREHYYSGNPKSLEAVTTTLDQMAMGGIYDHLGGGFARYSTDGLWKVPHFEKMLYDNGQLVSLYSEAYRLTRKPLYKKVVSETLDWVARELTSPDGGFYSSIDADSEGEEGKYYVWTETEIDRILEADAELFKRYYSVKPAGNWEHGNNILYVRETLEEMASGNGHSPEEAETIIASSRLKLLGERSKRERPPLDDKILTGWNALMLKGYVDAYRSFGDERYLQAARKNASFLMSNVLQKDGRLNRNYKNGKATINAFLDDYALLADALIELYQVTFDEQWLHKSRQLADYAQTHFFNPETGMFYFTSDEDPGLIARKTELSDNVIPGSNSTMARVLYRLGLYYYNMDYIRRSRQMLSNMLPYMDRSPTGNTNWAILLTEFLKEPFEIAVVGEQWEDISQEFNRLFMPDVLLLGGSTEGSLELLESKLVEGETRIYVCHEQTCRFPVFTVAEALEEMKAFYR